MDGTYLRRGGPVKAETTDAVRGEQDGFCAHGEYLQTVGDADVGYLAGELPRTGWATRSHRSPPLSLLAGGFHPTRILPSPSQHLPTSTPQVSAPQPPARLFVRACRFTLSTPRHHLLLPPHLGIKTSILSRGAGCGEVARRGSAATSGPRRRSRADGRGGCGREDIGAVVGRGGGGLVAPPPLLCGERWEEPANTARRGLACASLLRTGAAFSPRHRASDNTFHRTVSTTWQSRSPLWRWSSVSGGGLSPSEPRATAQRPDSAALLTVSRTLCRSWGAV